MYVRQSVPILGRGGVPIGVIVHCTTITPAASTGWRAPRMAALVAALARTRSAPGPAALNSRAGETVEGGGASSATRSPRQRRAKLAEHLSGLGILQP